MAQTPSLQLLEGLADQFSVRGRLWHQGRHFTQEGQRLEGRLGGHDAPLSYLTAQDSEHSHSKRGAVQEPRVPLDPHDRRQPKAVPCRAPLLAANGGNPVWGECDEIVCDYQPPVGISLNSLVEGVLRDDLKGKNEPQRPRSPRGGQRTLRAES